MSDSFIYILFAAILSSFLCLSYVFFLYLTRKRLLKSLAGLTEESKKL